MLAKISSGKSVFGVLAYNKIKIEEEHANVLYSQKMFASPDGTFSIRDCMDSFEPYLAMNQRTEKVVFHASLNPDPKDKLNDEQLAEIVQTYMEKLGYGNQPYIVFKHTDIDRTHCHLISLRIDETGKKINDSYEVARSMKICKELEQEFGLIPLERKQRRDEPPIKKIDYKAGDLKHQVSNITKSVMNHFYFQSFGEYRTLLEQFNIAAEEIKGEHSGKPYNGILYSVIGEDGKKQGKPFKSSLFGKEVGFNALQSHYELSKAAIEKKKIRETMKPIITQAMKRANNKEDFKLLLKEKGIGVIFRENEQHRIYGVSFIDYRNQTILNGSRLGKEFSANVFHELFKDAPKNDTKPTTLENPQTKKQSENFVSHSNNQDPSIGSVFGIFDMEPSGFDYEAEAFAREKEQENKNQRRKNKYRKKGRQV
jgi:hypothetical protein